MIRRVLKRLIHRFTGNRSSESEAQAASAAAPKARDAADARKATPKKTEADQVGASTRTYADSVDEALDETFPASDPPATSQPGARPR